MRIGINASSLLQTPDVGALADHAVQAEADGFHSWWLAQTGLIDALTAIAVAGTRTSSIQLGTAVVPSYTRHPQALAAQALTTAAAIGADRLVLGIGVSHKPVVEHSWGMEFERPVQHAIDYLEILNELFEDGSVAYDGDFFTNHGSYTIDPLPRPSVMFAALGEKMLRATGKRSDGSILWMVGPATVRDHIVPRLAAAAEEAGRGESRIVASLPIVVTDDWDGTRARADQAFEIYGHLPSYRAMLDREGVQSPSGVCLIGDESAVTDQLHALAEAGTTDFAALEFGATDDENQRTRAVLQDFSNA